MQKKSIKLWVTLLVLPIPLLIFTALLQVLTRATLAHSNAGTQNTNGFTILVNILSLLLGMAAMVMLIGIPLWIIMLVKTANYNNKLTSAATPPADTSQPPSL